MNMPKHSARSAIHRYGRSDDFDTAVSNSVRKMAAKSTRSIDRVEIQEAFITLGIRCPE